MRCLILGASGQVGGQLVSACAALRWPWHGTAFRHARPELEPLDLRDAAAVGRLVAECRPAVVFLPAAFCHVDGAETGPGACYAVNVGGTGNVAAAARDAGAVLVLFSTDHVFGDSPRPRREDEPVAPVNVYARSKVEAEHVVRELLPNRHLILRTSGVFGPDAQGKNFVLRAVWTLADGERLRVPGDQFGQPTFGPDLAAAAAELVQRKARGTFHVPGPELLSRPAFARLIAEVFGLDAGRIEAVPTAELNQPAPRALRVELDRGKLLAALGRDPIRAPRDGLVALRDCITSSPRRSAG